MKILIPHYGMRRVSDNQLMKDGSGRFITSPNKDVVEEYISASENSADFKVAEFKGTEIYCHPDIN